VRANGQTPDPCSPASDPWSPASDPWSPGPRVPRSWAAWARPRRPGIPGAPPSAHVPVAPPRPRARPWLCVPGPAATAPRTGRRLPGPWPVCDQGGDHGDDDLGQEHGPPTPPRGVDLPRHLFSWGWTLEVAVPLLPSSPSVRSAFHCSCLYKEDCVRDEPADTPWPR
jgi:hypothetical protein